MNRFRPLLKRIGGRLLRLLVAGFQQPRIFKYRLLSDCRRVVGKPICIQPVQLQGAGCITFEGTVRLGCYPSPFFFDSYCYLEARMPTAEIMIGDGTWINNRCVLISEHHGIRIGKKVLMGTGVEIIDSHFHGLASNRRNISSPEESDPVVIGNNVFVGSNARILQGVTIGDNSVIANGAVVVKNIPANVIAGGNPAKVLRIL